MANPRGEELLSRVSKLCIIMLSAIGDAVHVLPVVNALKDYRRDLHITWVIQPVPHALVKNHAAVDEFILFQRRSGSGMLRELWRCGAAIRAGRFDMALGLQVYLKAGCLLARSGAAIRLGFDRARARDLQWLFSTHRIPAHPPQHVQDQYFEFLDYLGVPHSEPRWRLEFSEAEQRERQVYFNAVKHPVCAVVVGTSKSEKNWLPERYGRLLTLIRRELRLEPMLVGGPSRTERELADRIAAATEVRPRYELGDDLRRLCYLLAGSRVVISPDTGPLHIARALSVPVVGLYGYTNPKRTGPYRKYQDLVVDGYRRGDQEMYPAGQGYRRNGMSRITVDMVMAKLRLALERYPVRDELR